MHFDNLSESRYAVRGELLPRGTKIQEQLIIGTPGKVLDWSSMKMNLFDLNKIKVQVMPIELMG